MNNMALELDEMIFLGACSIYPGLSMGKYGDPEERKKLAVTISRRIWKETLRALKEDDDV